MERGYDLHETYSLANAALLALQPQRIGATVITQNEQDIEAILRPRRFSLMLV
ncbi:MAG: hypothetical protein NUW06_01855 [Candidatus Acetothermia bacterium]|nr:hypothetical protein [Candidatus Acetothermia bacterium]MDH7504684.1 hypothetical protein [Candidatus Acetothermia bacterium]